MLNNNAKISDIIATLGDMQAINQKAELASVIGSPATATDNIATQITKIQDAKDVLAEKIGVENTTPLQQMAESLVVGKKWASGTVTISNATTSFTTISNTTKAYYYTSFNMTLLGFVPSKIIFFGYQHANIGAPVWSYDNLTNFGNFQANFSLATTGGSDQILKIPYSNGVVNIALSHLESDRGLTLNFVAFE